MELAENEIQLSGGLDWMCSPSLTYIYLSDNDFYLNVLPDCFEVRLPPEREKRP